MGVILSAKDIGISFGSNQVLKAVNFDLSEGEVLGIIGPNGAGKTVLLNIITGILKSEKGFLEFLGHDIQKLSIPERAKKGFGRTFQVPRSFANMTVYENCLAGAAFGQAKTEHAAKGTALEVLELIGLTDRRHQLAGKLGLLDRKRLEIGMALASDPKVLLLDEVAGGLTESEVNQVLSIVAGIKTKGIGIIWIEHVIQTMLHGTDRVMLLAEGVSLLTGDPEMVMASPEVERVYLGAAGDKAPVRCKGRFCWAFPEGNVKNDG